MTEAFEDTIWTIGGLAILLVLLARFMLWILC